MKECMDHYDTFFCVPSSKPIRGQWKAFHCCWRPLPHSTAELEARWIVVQDNVMLLDWMPGFDLTGCPWGCNKGWYVNNQSGNSRSVLHLSVRPVRAPRGQGHWGGGVRGRYKKKEPFISAPIWDSCRVTHGVVACLVSHPQSTRQWHADSRAWHQVSCRLWANPLFSMTEETQRHQAPELIIKTPQPQRALHLHLNGRLPCEVLVLILTVSHWFVLWTDEEKRH